MLESIGGFLLFIIWVPLTFVIFVKLKEGKQIISFDGMNGFFSAYLDILIMAGFLAALVLALPIIILGGIFGFLLDNWKIIAGIVLLVAGVCYYNNEHETDSEEKIACKGADSLNHGPDGAEDGNAKQLAAPGFCDNCGTKLDPDSRFCAHCGKPVR